MEDLKRIIAANLTELRRLHGMTQLDLAAKLNYTDKAVSKWERGESIPDVCVLKTVADLFEVSVDYLLTDDHTDMPLPAALTPPDPAVLAQRRRNRIVISGLAVMLVWLIATFAFTVVGMVVPYLVRHAWLAFVYAAPVSFIVWLVFNSIWFDRKRNFLIVSLLMWSALLSFHLSFVSFTSLNNPIWLVYFLGIPGQFIILTWSRMNTPKK